MLHIQVPPAYTWFTIQSSSDIHLLNNNTSDRCNIDHLCLCVCVSVCVCVCVSVSVSVFVYLYVRMCVGACMH